MDTIKNAVEQTISNLGPSEYTLAVSKVEDPLNVNAIVEAIYRLSKAIRSETRRRE